MAIINVNQSSTWFQRVKGTAATGDGSGSDASNPLTPLTFVEEIGEKGDAAATTASGSLSAIALLKGVLAQLLESNSRPQTATTTNTAAAGTTASFTLIAASTTQKKRLITNGLNVNLFIRFSATAATTSNFSTILAPSSVLSIGPGDYFGEMRAIAPGATTGHVSVTHWS